MDFITAVEVSASGLSAQRSRMNNAAANLANANTTRSEKGGPFRRQDIVLESVPLDPLAGDPGSVSAVRVSAVSPDTSPPRMEYDPGHPDADANGYVAYPNVNVVEEMVDMITASRAYEAGITSLGAAVSMAERALGIGRQG